MGINSFPDSRFTYPITLPNSAGPLANSADGVTWNQGQSVVVINGKTYIFLVAGEVGVENGIRFWSDNPNYYTTNPFDTSHNLIFPLTGILVGSGETGFIPKAFADGSSRLYLSYFHYNGTVYEGERVAVCPNPAADVLDPTGWYHTDLSTTIATGGGFEVIPAASGVPTIDNMARGSLFVRDGYLLSAWQGISTSDYYTTLALTQLGSGSWTTYEYVLAGTGNAVVTPALMLERQPIAYIDPWGYIHMFVLNGHTNMSYVVHLHSLTPWALDFPTEYSKKPGLTAGMDTHYEPYKTILDLNWSHNGFTPGTVGVRTHGTTCVTPDGQYSFSVGDIRTGPNPPFGANIYYSMSKMSDPSRPYNGNPNPWLLGDQQYLDNSNVLQKGSFKNNHTALTTSDSELIADGAQLLLPAQTSPTVYPQPSIIPSRGAMWDEDPLNPGVPLALPGARTNLYHSSALYLARANDQVMPRADSLGFFWFKPDKISQRVLFSHVNLFGVFESTVLVTLSDRPTADVHTIGMSNNENIIPVVFGEYSPFSSKQVAYYITFFGGAPPIPRASNPKVGGNLEMVQAYTEEPF